MKAEEFNKKFSVGDPVTYKSDFGTLFVTKTRSRAWNLACGTGVVKIHGRSGGYDCERIDNKFPEDFE